MRTEHNDQYIGQEVGYEAVNHVVQGAEEYCACEKMRIETVNQPEILALRAELALLSEKERDLKERIRHAPPPGDFHRRRQSLYCWAVVIFLAVAGFFFTLMALDPYRLGWKGYLYSLGVAIICPYCVDKFLESWGSQKLVKTLAAAACFAALTSLVLLAFIRGNVLAQYVQSASPAVIMDGEMAASVPPHDNFFDATLPYLRLTMMLLAFSMELGAGLALHDARRLRSDSGEDYNKLNQERDVVCHEMVVRIHRLTALQNAPQAFVAEFWRDFHRALLNGATRSALKRVSLLLLCFLLFRPGLMHAAERIRVVVALDLSRSVAVKGSDNKAEFEKNLDAISHLIAHVPAGSRVTVLGITADSFAQPYLLLDARLDGDEGYFKERLAAGRNQVVGAWRKRCVRLSPEFSHTDNFGALLVASELFKQTPQARKVLVILSDMRNETAAINLESPSVIAVNRFLAKAEKNRLLADLPGVEVYVLGVDSAGKTVSYWNSLRDFWTQYFRQVGARLQTYSILRELPDTALVP
jgi:hypothetical protein